MKPWHWYRGRLKHAEIKGEPIAGTGQRRRDGPCPEGPCSWCKPRTDWIRSTERAAVRREVRDDRD